MKLNTLLAAALISSTIAANAATRTFTGSGTATTWTTLTAWDGGETLPSSDDDIVFTDTAGNTGVTLTGATTVKSLSFSELTNRTNFTISGGSTTNTLTIGAGGISYLSGDDTTAYSSTKFFSFAAGTKIVLAADQTWDIGGKADGSDYGLRMMNETGKTNYIDLSTASLTKKGTGQLTFLGVTMSGDNDFNIDNGYVKFNASSKGGNIDVTGGGKIAVAKDATLGLYKNSGIFTAFTKKIELAGGAKIYVGGSSNAWTLGSDIVVTAGDAPAIVESISGMNPTFGGAFSGAGTLKKTGAGNLAISKDQKDFLGTIETNAGTLTFSETQTGLRNLVTSGGTTTFSKADNAITNFTASGGTVSYVGATGNEITNLNVNANTTTIDNTGATAVTDITIDTITGNGGRVSFAGINQKLNVNVNNILSGTDGAIIAATKTTTINFLTKITYNGAIYSTNGGSIVNITKVGNTIGEIKTGSGAGLYFSGTGTDSIYNTINRVTSDGGVTTLSAGITKIGEINLLNGGLVQANNIADSVVYISSGQIGSATGGGGLGDIGLVEAHSAPSATAGAKKLSLVKEGEGDLYIRAASSTGAKQTYTGSTTIAGGALILEDSSKAGTAYKGDINTSSDITVKNGAKLYVNGSTNVTVAGGVTLENGAILQVGSNGGTVSSAINIQGDTTITGQTEFIGKVTLSDNGRLNVAGTYTGGVDIAAGHTGILAADMTGNLTALTGSTLKGAGTITGNLSANGATINIGNSPGTITVTGNADLTNATIKVEYATDGVDVLDVAGTITLDNTTLEFTNTSGLLGLEPHDYKLFGVSNSLSAEAAGAITITGLEGYNFTWMDVGGANAYLQIQAIPEPSTYALLGGIAAAGVALVARRRKRG